MILKTNTITIDAYNELKARKERESVKKTLTEFLTQELTTLKVNEVKEVIFDKDVHYYSVLKALRMFDKSLEYKINSDKSRVFSIAIKKL